MKQQHTVFKPASAMAANALQRLAERLDNERHQVRSAIIRHIQGSLTVHALNKISTYVAALADDLGELAMSLLVDSRGN
jgi:hypothetical protein